MEWAALGFKLRKHLGQRIPSLRYCVTVNDTVTGVASIAPPANEVTRIE
jgi:hypothetical protein